MKKENQAELHKVVYSGLFQLHKTNIQSNAKMLANIHKINNVNVPITLNLHKTLCSLAFLPCVCFFFDRTKYCRAVNMKKLYFY